MSRNKIFIRRRDGRIEVRLNDDGRVAVRDMFVHVVASERDPNHDWHNTVLAPIDPSKDDDDPALTLARQHDIATNAELAVMTTKEEFLTDAEAWAWLCSLQIALRATAFTNGLLTDEKLESAEPSVLAEVRMLQLLLFELAACF